MTEQQSIVIGMGIILTTCRVRDQSMIQQYIFCKKNTRRFIPNTLYSRAELQDQQYIMLTDTTGNNSLGDAVSTIATSYNFTGQCSYMQMLHILNIQLPAVCPGGLVVTLEY